MTKTATIKYSEELAETLRLDDQEIEREIGFLAAAKLYELGRVSAGQAAELAGLRRLEFLQRLATTDVPAINLLGSEVEAEIEAARELARCSVSPRACRRAWVGDALPIRRRPG